MAKGGKEAGAVKGKGGKRKRATGVAPSAEDIESAFVQLSRGSGASFTTGNVANLARSLGFDWAYEDVQAMMALFSGGGTTGVVTRSQFAAGVQSARARVPS
jgi:hypothetical protein